MYVCTPIGAHSARRSLIGALIGALCGIDVSQVKYAHIENIYIYIDAPIGLEVLYMYVCMHVCTYYVCMYVCTPIGAHSAR